MPDINPSLPVVGQPDSTEEPKIVTALTQLIAAINDIDSDNILDGTITGADLATSIAASLGLDSGTTNRRALVHNASAEAAPTLTSGSLPTPDKISDLVIPTTSLVLVSYFARFTTTSVNTGVNLMAQLTFGTNLQGVNGLTSTGRDVSGDAAISYTPGAAGTYSGFICTSPYGKTAATSGFTSMYGMAGGASSGSLGGTPDDAEGFILPGFIPIVLAAGTYDLEAIWWARSGSSSVQVQDRYLAAIVQGF